jgi:hypothetical protein
LGPMPSPSTSTAGNSALRVVDLAAGAYHSVALLSSGRVLAWGDGSQGATSVPAAAQQGDVVRVAAAAGRTFALLANGALLAWGGDTAVAACSPHATSGGAERLRGGILGGGGLEPAGAASRGEGVPPDLAFETVLDVAGGTCHGIALVAA